MSWTYFVTAQKCSDQILNRAVQNGPGYAADLCKSGPPCQPIVPSLLFTRLWYWRGRALLAFLFSNRSWWGIQKLAETGTKLSQWLQHCETRIHIDTRSKCDSSVPYGQRWTQWPWKSLKQIRKNTPNFKGIFSKPFSICHLQRLAWWLQPWISVAPPRFRSHCTFQLVDHPAGSQCPDPQCLLPYGCWSKFLIRERPFANKNVTFAKLSRTPCLSFAEPMLGNHDIQLIINTIQIISKQSKKYLKHSKTFQNILHPKYFSNLQHSPANHNHPQS